MKTFLKNNQQFLSIFFIVIILLLAMVAIDWLDPRISGRLENIIIHSIMEILSVLICLAIFLFGWFLWSATKSSIILAGAVGFLTIALLNLMHIFTYLDIQFFFFQTSHQMSMWFTVMARYTEVFTLTIIGFLYFRQQQTSNPFENYLFLSLWIGYAILISVIIFLFGDSLPNFAAENNASAIKNSLEYLLALFYLSMALLLVKEFSKPTVKILIPSFCLLALSGFSLTLYNHVDELIVTLAHILKIIGYFYILRLFYDCYMRSQQSGKLSSETQLNNVKKQLHALFKYTPDAVLLFMLEDRKILSSNPAFKTMFGYENTKDMIIDQIVPSEVNQEFENVFYELKQGKTIVDFKTKRYRADGTILDVSITYSPVNEKRGGEALYFSIIRDITVQKNLEKEIQAARQELIDLLKQYHGIIGKITKVNGEFIHTFVDGKLIKKLNLYPETIIGNKLNSFINHDKVDFLKSLYEKAWKGEEIVKEYTADNGMILLLSIIPVKREGAVVELIISVIDLTSIKETEELLRKSEKLSIVGELAAGFAHEIRNPLTTIKGFIQLIKKSEDPQNIRYMTIMLEEIDRLETITNEFMMVARPQATLYQEENINDIIQNVVLFMTPQSLLKDIQIFPTYLKESCTIFGDKNQLKQVFINILKNAFEAMELGGEIFIRVEKNGKDILISIKDEGCGIPAEIIPKLGEPFYTLKEKGTGLGLMVSHKIIEAHHGKLQIESILHVGTTILITLPKLTKKLQTTSE